MYISTHFFTVFFSKEQILSRLHCHLTGAKDEGVCYNVQCVAHQQFAMIVDDSVSIAQYIYNSTIHITTCNSALHNEIAYFVHHAHMH